MSVLEELQTLEDRVRSRLRELEPLVAEYRQLSEAAQRMGIDVTAAGDTSAAGNGTSSAPAPAPAAKRTRGSKRAARNGTRSATKSTGTRRRKGGTGAGTSAREIGTKRRQQVLDLIRSRPGITVRELGQELQVDPTALYRVVRRLESDGSIKKVGTALQPVEAAS